MPLDIIQTGPAAGPCVSLDEIKAQLVISSSQNDDDNLLIAMALAAEQDAERRINRAIVSRPVLIKLAGLPPGGEMLLLNIPQLRAITAIEVASPTTGEFVAIDSALYGFEGASELGAMVWLKGQGAQWPAVDTTRPNPVRITGTLGWPVAEVPQVIKQWVLMTTASLYEHREAWTVGGKPANENAFINHMLEPFRRYAC